MNKEIVLFDQNKDCCACGACANICPKNAITMVENEQGFVYPKINTDYCIECGACMRTCGFKTKISPVEFQQKIFAFASKNKDILTKSASGGAFAEIAKYVLSNKAGVVYGAVEESREQNWKIHHKRIESIEDLEMLQGSKYVQSEIGTAYREIKKDLLDGRNVLFSGTPCQVDGLNNFLGREYDNLLTVDIICHGVPSQKMFTDFLKYQEGKLNKKIERFIFRDKSKGQGMISRIDICGSNKSIVKKGELYSYFYFFLKQHIYRDNCYICPYARRERVSDLTIGDFWGFAKIYPEVDKKILSDERGVSCIIANTEKGLSFILNNLTDCTIMDSDFEKASAYNGQLSAPSHDSDIRAQLLEKYVNQGYSALDSYYNTHFWKDRIKYNISAILPTDFKRNVRRLFR